jgi:thiamine transporter ThiT
MAASDFHHGDQDVSANKAAYHGFTIAYKWGSLHLAAIILWLVLWFCTPAGFWSGLIAGVVLFVVGAVVLTRKPKAAGH